MRICLCWLFKKFFVLIMIMLYYVKVWYVIYYCYVDKMYICILCINVVIIFWLDVSDENVFDF